MLMTPQGHMGALPAVPGMADQAQANLWNTRFHCGQAGTLPSQLSALPFDGSGPQPAAAAAAGGPEAKGKAKAKSQARAKAKSKPTLEKMQPLSQELVLAEALKYCQMLAAFVTKHRSDVEKAKELGLSTPSVGRLEVLLRDLSVTLDQIQGLVVSQNRDVGTYSPIMEATCSPPARPMYALVFLRICPATHAIARFSMFSG